MNVMEYLDASSSSYEIKSHRPVFTAQQMAQEEHIHGMNVAKPVIVKGDGEYFMCVLPACCEIDFDALKSVLEVSEIHLVGTFKIRGFLDDLSIPMLLKDSMLGPAMLARSKLHVLGGEKVKDRGVVKRIFDRCMVEDTKASE